MACPPYGIDYIASILIPADGRTRPPRFSLELRRSHVHAFTIQNKTHLSRNHSVVPDGVTGPETNPLRNRTVLLLGFGKLLLGAEGLLGLLVDSCQHRTATWTQTKNWDLEYGKQSA